MGTVVGLLGVLAAGLDPAAVAGQSRAVESAQTCWRGAPPPACGGFFIVEAQGVFPLVWTRRFSTGLDGNPTELRAFESRLEWNLGYMVNLSPAWAAGGAVSLGTGAYDAFTGLRLRVRRWIGPELSVELQGGLVRTHAANQVAGEANGISADVRLNAGDHGSFFVRWDGVPLPDRRLLDDQFQPASFDQALIVGVGTGSTWTVVGTGLLAMFYVAALSTLDLS